MLPLRLLITLACLVTAARADDAADLRQRGMAFHLANQQRSGVLIPMYVYPENIHTHPAYNRLMETKRKYETVPIWVIVNPASGPGTTVDANYTKAIDRLRGAGCVVIGYVSTRYSQQPRAEVVADLRRWRQMYPKVQGIFFDEMIYEDVQSGVDYQRAINNEARNLGYWPTVANPGTQTPGRYFEAEVADVIVIHENAQWPDLEQLKGDFFGGNSDFPPSSRALLLHSQSKFDRAAFDRCRPYARWFYITHRPYRANDPTALNPWDDLTKHLDDLCAALADHP